MEKYIKLFLFTAIFLITGCESIIDVMVPYSGPKLTINGYLQPDSSIYFSLTESKFILDDNSFVSIDNAKVNIYEDEIDIGRITSSGNGWYTSKKKPKGGKHYSIKVESDKFGIVNAEAYIPERVSIVDVLISNQRSQRDYEQYHIIEVKIDDPSSANFYEIILLATINEKIYRNDSLISRKVENHSVDLAFGDPALEDQNTFGGSSFLVFDDINLKGTQNTMKIYAKTNQLVNLQKKEQVFYNNSEKNKIVRDDALYLILRHTDDAYFYFRKSLHLQSRNKGNPFAEPVKVYSNVRNGHGIFAGYTSSRHKIDVSLLRGK